MSRDTVESEPPYQYVRGNPINLSDPLGLAPPLPAEWESNGGPHVATGTYIYAINKVYKNRTEIISAAQRHGFLQSPVVCPIDPNEIRRVNTLAAIIYQESIGWFRELQGLNDKDEPSDDPQDQADVQLSTFGFLNTSIGIAQVSHQTALDIEQSGVLQDPYQSTSTNPIFFTTTWYEELFGEARISRLLDDIWAIEYAAANMERATHDPSFNSHPDDEWGKIATFYNSGVVSPEFVQERFRQQAMNYRDIMYANILALEALDVLELKEQCKDCPPPIPLHSATPTYPLPLQSAPGP